MLWQISRDERARAFCTNFVLQVTNAQGLGTRLEFFSLQTLSSIILIALHCIYRIVHVKTKCGNYMIWVSLTLDCSVQLSFFVARLLLQVHCSIINIAKLFWFQWCKLLKYCQR